MENKKITFAFFGASEFSTIILSELEAAGLVPKIVITAEDKPAGRKMIVTPPPAKVWAEHHGIKIFQPKTLREPKEPGITEKLRLLASDSELFVVASYGKIIPQEILDIPKHGTLNVHPSLLPKLRGPSPIESAILTEDETGVSIMLLDAEMDHGPLLAQEKTDVAEWPPYADELEVLLAHQGGKMLAEAIPLWIEGKIEPKEQDHAQATLCKKIAKEDGLLDMSESALTNLRKIRAFRNWPSAYFFIEKAGKKIRIIVKEAHIENGELVIDAIVPEGKKEMAYSDFMRNL